MPIRSLKTQLAAFLLFLLVLMLSPSAFADKPPDEPEKGTQPAGLCQPAPPPGSSEIYDPVPVETDLVFIGLSFNEDTVEAAVFENAEGGGFRVGLFDDERSFQPLAESASSVLIVHLEYRWYLLLDEVFDNVDPASAVAQRYAGRVVGMDGEIRVIVGPLKDEYDVDYTRRWYGLSGEAWRENCLVAYDDAGRRIHMQTQGDTLAVEPISSGSGRTVYDDELYAGGFVLRIADLWHMTVINAVPLEDYVKGVIPYEMSPSWPYEALKAQAVCARSYAAYHIGDYWDEYGFDLTNDTDSQVYRGLYGADAVTDAAVDATRGMFVRYRGELCEVYYFSSDGGATEDGVNIFGSDRPYLAGKTDPFEAALDSAVIRWERWRGGDEIAARLQRKGYEIGTVVSVEPVCSELGNVIGMRYTDEAGRTVSLSGRDSYSFLSLDNCRFRVEKDEYGFLFSGRGWGHNCGMSQWGANAMASAYGLSAEDIIEFYFTGAYIG